jgi:hypothetical protein
MRVAQQQLVYDTHKHTFGFPKGNNGKRSAKPLPSSEYQSPSTRASLCLLIIVERITAV